jgi:S-adenosylmethionine:tRNA ribosyltransferase-isomerase
MVSPAPDLDRLDAYDFALDADLIATEPSARRTSCRLLHLDVAGDRWADLHFSDLTTLLRPGDLLVMNDARVVPARLDLCRSTGGRIEVLVLGLGEEGRWDDAMAPAVCMSRGARRLRVGEQLAVDSMPDIRVRVEQPAVDGMVRLALDSALPTGWWTLMESAGALPLPPYIEQARERRGEDIRRARDREDYQTVWASRPGAVAAPTAGLHFDHPLLEALDAMGVARTEVTLWVGAGTFLPVRGDTLSGHRMHEEWWEVGTAAAEAWEACRARGGRVVAVGTTVVRTLESAIAPDGLSLAAGQGRTGLMIRPPFTFRAVDLLVTNFHLPRSTLMALVCALGGHDLVMRAYRHAAEAGYRFFSYGDAMLIDTLGGGAR